MFLNKQQPTLKFIMRCINVHYFITGNISESFIKLLVCLSFMTYLMVDILFSYTMKH